MKGPSLKLDLRVLRTWTCPACARVVRTPGRETSLRCSCTGQPIQMKLQEPSTRLVFDPAPFMTPEDPSLDVEDDAPDGLEEATAAVIAALQERAAAAQEARRPQKHYDVTAGSESDLTTESDGDVLRSEADGESDQQSQAGSRADSSFSVRVERPRSGPRGAGGGGSRSRFPENRSSAPRNGGDRSQSDRFQGSRAEGTRNDNSRRPGPAPGLRDRTTLTPGSDAATGDATSRTQRHRSPAPRTERSSSDRGSELVSQTTGDALEQFGKTTDGDAATPGKRRRRSGRRRSSESPPADARPSTPTANSGGSEASEHSGAGQSTIQAQGRRHRNQQDRRPPVSPVPYESAGSDSADSDFGDGLLDVSDGSPDDSLLTGDSPATPGKRRNRRRGRRRGRSSGAPSGGDAGDNASTPEM